MNDKPGRPATDAEIEAATIPIREGRYFAAIWFVNSADRTKDWLATIFRDPGGDWQGRYRFRYYRDTKVHNSADKKNAAQMTLPASTPEADAVKGFTMLAEMIAKEYGGEVHKLVLRTDKSDVILAAIRREPFFHLANG